MSTIDRLSARGKGGVAPRTPPGFFERSGWPLIILGLLELAWLGWFLCEPLPNASSPRGAITRGLLLLDTFPGVVPGVVPAVGAERRPELPEPLPRGRSPRRRPLRRRAA